MTDLQTAAQQALESLIRASSFYDTYSEIEALRAALADEPQQTHSADCWRWHHECAISKIQWMHTPLTTQQVDDMLTSGAWSAEELVRAVERAHGIGDPGRCPRCGKRLGDGLHTCTPPGVEEA